MRIVGRKFEIAELERVFNSGRSEFIVVYGRRRIGKTFLIEQFYGTKDCCFFHATGIKNAPMKVQLKEFSKHIGNAFFGGADIAPQASWSDAFQELSKAIALADKSKNIVLFLDELPWLCTPKSNLIQALEYYWNRYWKEDKRVKLVICGSSASWMIRKIINSKGGLHNRCSLRLLLKPLRLAETKEFLRVASNITLNNRQVTELYMITGGVPYYLSFAKKGMSAAQIVDGLCFQGSGILHDEFDKLFESLFDNAESYKSIIRSIAKKREGCSASYIAKELGLSTKNGSLARFLQELEDAAFIKSFVPLGNKRQMKFYRVIDEYCYFYLRWIEPAKKKMLVDLGGNAYWQSCLKTPEFYSWRGYTFESLCYKHLTEIIKALDLNNLEAIGAWKYIPRKDQEGVGAQIDLIFDRRDGVVTICEIKYTDEPFTLTKLNIQSIKNKIEIFRAKTKTAKHVSIALISAKGVKKNHQEIDQVVTLNDFFADDD